MKFGTVPPEPHRLNALDLLAPKFQPLAFEIIHELQDLGFDPYVYESGRTDERQVWEFGFGRLYDDDRGIVTDIEHGWADWHFYGLAFDIISESKEWDAPQAFWDSVIQATVSRGLTAGGCWKRRDQPHVQWNIPGMHVSPSAHAKELYDAGGVDAVWQELHAR